MTVHCKYLYMYMYIAYFNLKYMIVVKRNCILTEKEKKRRSEISNYDQRPTKMEWKGLCLKYAVNYKAVKSFYVCVSSP